MNYFEKLIDKIEEIEDNFNIINSRIIEFGESTDYKHIDFGLVNKYNNLLLLYLDFLSKEKSKIGENLDNIIDKEEFEATKKLTQKRISILEDKLAVLQKKVSKIDNIKKQSMSKKDMEEFFESSEQMECLKKLLSDFKENLSIYKSLQKDIGIEIDLDDRVEKEIENKNDDETMIIVQNEFIDNYSHFLEEILNIKNRNIDLISKKTETLFNIILEKDLYITKINEIFDKKYIVGLDLEKSKIFNDYNKFLEFNKKIELLLDISKFCSDFDGLLELTKNYGLEGLILKYSDLNKDLKSKILDLDIFDLDKLILKIDNDFGIDNIKNIFKFFDGIPQLIDTFKRLKGINFDIVNEYYAGAFSRIFITSEKVENIVGKIIEDIVNTLLISISTNDIEENSKLLLEKIDLLNKLYYGLVSSNVKIKFYHYPFVLSQLKREIKNFLFVYKGEKYYDELIGYYIEVANNKYKNDRVKHISNNSYSRGGYSSGGYSSSGSSWSSSSSSGSSSYSSSGSSSW